MKPLALALALALTTAAVACSSADAPSDPTGAAAQALAPTWSLTTNMAFPGDDLAGAPLPGGRALLVNARAQLYASNLFREITAPPSAHSDGAATPLTDGRVLVVGGATAAVDLFDPTTEAWTAGPAMANARTNHRAVRLGDGSVLVTGGGPTTAERYSPATNAWSAAGDHGARPGSVPVLLADGRVLLTGGGVTSVVLYDPSTNAWTPTGALLEPRQSHAAFALADGRVLVAGGDDILNGPGTLTTSELWSPATGTWSAGPALPRGFRNSAFVTLGEGTLALIIAGRAGITDTAVFTAATSAWAAGPGLYWARWDVSATVMDDGRVLVWGGESPHIPPYQAEVACLDLGCPCATTIDCMAGTCVDGVCCDGACDGPCQACSAALKQGGRDGRCGPVVDGADPDDDCAAEGPETCGTLGSCDGAGSCRRYPSNTECAAASCVASNQRQPAGSCDGAGTCTVPTVVTCSPGSYCSGGSCAPGCSQDSDCLTGYTCRAGTCALGPDGEACTAPADCASGFCVDGVCCESACTGQCESCAGATPGLCLAVTGAPQGTRAACTGSGPCAGTCGGSRTACVYPGAETSCGAGSTCSNGACVRTAATCADADTSQPVSGAPVECEPYGCDATTGTCRETCAVSLDCAAGHVCSAPDCVLGSSGTGGSNGTGGSAGAGGGPSGNAAPKEGSGCACRTTPTPLSDPWGWLGAVPALAAVRRRRGAAARHSKR